MTVPRSRLVDLQVTRYYHCISRCVRRAMLCGEGFEYRKQWIEDRLETLAGAFAVAVCGFAVMDNHLHLLLRLDPDLAKDWSDEQVVRRWMAVYPPRDLADHDAAVVDAWVRQLLARPGQVQQMRQRLTNLGWFMKALKEPLSRMANREDDCRGAFWEGRYKSIAILDEEALLATCVYIDLNPLAAGLAALPETSKHTSIRRRVQHVKSRGQLSVLQAARRGSVAGSRAAGDLERDLWLCPVESRRGGREGMLSGFSLGSYLLLLDYTSRLRRQGKARVSGGVASILDRLGSSAEIWRSRLDRLFGQRRLLGNYFATDRGRLRQLAQQRGVHHLDNLAGLGG